MKRATPRVILTRSLLAAQQQQHQPKCSSTAQQKQVFVAKAKKKEAGKMKIDQSLRTAVWNQQFGETVGRAVCPVCKTQMITQRNFHCGHIIAEALGGATNVDNLMPICAQCNLSMGTQNLHAYAERFAAASCWASVRIRIVRFLFRF